MDKTALLDMALEKLMGDMDDLEGASAMSHSAEECPDPLSCKAHDSELGENLTPGEKSPAAVEIEVHKGGLPSMDGEKSEDSKAEDGLSPEEAEELRKLLK
jgi:hypothetical protein